MSKGEDVSATSSGMRNEFANDSRIDPHLAILMIFEECLENPYEFVERERESRKK